MNVQGLIGWNLKRLRVRHGVSQEELALRVQIIDQTYISKLERGHRNPTAVMLYLIADGLRVEVGEFFSTSGAPSHLTDGPVKLTSTRSGRVTITSRPE